MPFRDDEPPEFIAVDFERVEVRKARYEHRCDACSKPIQPGETYTRIWAFIEGVQQVQKFHGTIQGSCYKPEDYGIYPPHFFDPDDDPDKED